MIDTATARMVVCGGAGVGGLIWLLGLKAYGRLTSEPSRFRKRVPVRSAGPDAFAEIVRWGTAEGRQIVDKGDRRITVRIASFLVDLSLFDDVSGPALEIKADLSALKRKYALGMGLVVLVVAPLVIAGLSFFLYTYAAPSNKPGIRGQVFQIFQMIHVLWPPLAFCGQYRNLRTRLLDPLGASLSALIDAGTAATGGR